MRVIVVMMCVLMLMKSSDVLICVVLFRMWLVISVMMSGLKLSLKKLVSMV